MTFDAADFPESYQVNNNKEKLVLAYAENFRKQYVHLYQDRKPIFLNPLNELQVEVGFVILSYILLSYTHSLLCYFKNSLCASCISFAKLFWYKVKSMANSLKNV